MTPASTVETPIERTSSRAENGPIRTRRRLTAEPNGCAER
jgi:hypothetical protein